MNAARCLLSRPCFRAAHAAMLLGLLFAARPDATIAAESDAQSIRQLLDDGWYQRAETAAAAWLERVESAHGPESPAALEALDLLVESLWRQGKVHGDARALAERALSTRSRHDARGDAHIGRSWNNLGNVLTQLGHFDSAEAAFDSALAIRERVLPADHPDLVWTLNDFAGFQSTRGRYAEARVLTQRVLEIRLRLFGPEHPLVAWNLSSLAYLDMLQGDYPGAVRGFERVLAIRERVLPPEHPDIAHVLNYLSILYQKLGDMARARAACERGLSIREKSLGPRSADVAKSLVTLASIHRQDGDYIAARRCSDRSLEIREEVFGRDHPEVATSLVDVASQKMITGDFAGTERLLERARKIRSDSFGARSANVAAVLEKESELALLLGRPERARAIALEALSILRAALGKDHGSVAPCLLRLGAAGSALHQEAAAESAYREALAIQERAWGPESPEVGRTSMLLAGVHETRGDLERALALSDRALDVHRRLLGPRHPEVAAALEERAGILAARGDVPSAFDAALEAESIGREHLRMTIRVLAERLAMSYESVREGGLDLAISIAVDSARADFARRAGDALVRSRALVLEELTLRQTSRLHQAPDSTVSDRARAFFALRAQLAQLTVTGLETGLKGRYRSVIDSLARACERAESDLAERSVSFRREHRRAHTGLSDVLESLPRGSAIVGFARYRHARRGATAGEPRYVALVGQAGGSTALLVPIESAAKVDSLVHELRRALDSPASSSDEGVYRRIGDRLRRSIWDPLVPHLRGVSLVFVVPDGTLNGVNLTALPERGSATRYLVDSGVSVHLLAAERDIVRDAPVESASGLLAIGGVRFERGERGSDPSVPSSRGAGGGKTTLRSFEPAADCDSLRFDPLPASQREVEEIVELWRQRTSAARSPLREPLFELCGHQATKRAFLELAPRRRVIHVATHGFVLDERCVHRARNRSEGETAKPLQISGLALAGANGIGASRAAREALVTSEEIAALDLTGTEWVVLSACKSGIGEFVDGEGVLGMRRAFHASGAASVIMSLWRVDDAAARRWMRSLYRARWERGASTSDAVREASLEFVRTQRARGESTHPRLWAAFVAEGDWR